MTQDNPAVLEPVATAKSCTKKSVVSMYGADANVNKQVLHWTFVSM